MKQSWLCSWFLLCNSTVRWRHSFGNFLKMLDRIPKSQTYGPLWSSPDRTWQCGVLNSSTGHWFVSFVSNMSVTQETQTEVLYLTAHPGEDLQIPAMELGSAAWTSPFVPQSAARAAQLEIRSTWAEERALLLEADMAVRAYQGLVLACCLAGHTPGTAQPPRCYQACREPP